MNHVYDLLSKGVPLPTLYLVHSQDAARQQLSNAFKSIGFEVESFASFPDVNSINARVGSLWILFDDHESIEEHVALLHGQKYRVFWGILILGQRNEAERDSLLSAGADDYLAYPFGKSELIKATLQLLAERTPVSTLNVLPKQVATSIDKLFLRLDKLDYFKLLEVDQSASPNQITRQFHQRSVILHPDRHYQTKRTHPHVYRRIQQVFKRILEAYQVLSNPNQRALYSLLVVQGFLRWDQRAATELQSELSLSRTEEGKKLLLDSITARRQGHLLHAHAHAETLAKLEPNNADIQALLSSYQCLIKVVDREPSLQAQLTEMRLELQ